MGDSFFFFKIKVQTTIFSNIYLPDQSTPYKLEYLSFMFTKSSSSVRIVFGGIRAAATLRFSEFKKLNTAQAFSVGSISKLMLYFFITRCIRSNKLVLFTGSPVPIINMSGFGSRTWNRQRLFSCMSSECFTSHESAHLKSNS